MQDQLTQIRRVTVVGALVNLFLTIIKIFVGLSSSSMSLVADGIHSLSDLATDAAIWIGVRFWSAPPDKNHPYGHGRYETLINLFIAGVLGFVGSGIGWRAIFSIISGTPSSRPEWNVFYIAIISIVAKELLFRWTFKKGKENKSAALTTNAWHHRSDALSSMPVAIAIIGEMIYPAFHYYDQIAAITVTILLLHATWRLAKPSIFEIMEATPNPALNTRIREMSKSITGINNVHSVRCRKLGGEILVDMHMDVDPNMTVFASHELTRLFHDRVIQEIPEITNTLIHVEPAHKKKSSRGSRRNRKAKRG